MAPGPGCSRVTLRPPPPPGWNELLIASFSHRSIAVKDGILLATGLHVHRNSAHSAGVGAIFDRWGPRPTFPSRLAWVPFTRVSDVDTEV